MGLPCARALAVLHIVDRARLAQDGPHPPDGAEWREAGHSRLLADGDRAEASALLEEARGAYDLRSRAAAAF